MQRLSQILPRTRFCRPGKLPPPPPLTEFSFVPAMAPFSTQVKTGPRLDENNEPRFLEQVKLFYNEASAMTGISDEYLKLIAACQTVVRFNIPLRRDDGTIETVTCYR